MDTAAAAYREMVAFRTEHGLNELRDELATAGWPFPYDMARFRPITELIEKGLRYPEYSRDKFGNMVTVCDIGHLAIKKVNKAKLGDLYVESCWAAEEHMNHVLDMVRRW